MEKESLVILKYISLVTLLALPVMAGSNIRYAKSDMHAQTIKKGEFDFSFDYNLLNNTIDILKLKQSELSSTNNIGAIGDLNGYGVKLRYGLTSSLMLSFEYSKNDIQYLSSTMTNKKYEFYTRYNLIQNNSARLNNGLAFDVGYIGNRFHDFKITDIKTIENLIKKKIDGFSFRPPRNGNYSAIAPGIAPVTLEKPPYESIEDSGDDSLYLRAITGFHEQEHTIDFFLGYKYTKIRNRFNTNDELVNLAKAYAKKKKIDFNDINPRQNLDRHESMLFGGFNYTLDMSNLIYEFTYEYDRLFRDAGLDYINYNHIFNGSVSYAVNKNLLISLSAKAMYRQFNGVIPYMYNKYTDTTFDHKYGYASLGFTYLF